MKFTFIHGNNFNTCFESVGVILLVSTYSIDNRKVGFLVVELSWKIFSQTGNVETYLLMKELEAVDTEEANMQLQSDVSDTYEQQR